MILYRHRRTIGQWDAIGGSKLSGERQKQNCRVTVRITERMRRDVQNYSHARWQSMSKWIIDAIAAHAERCRMEDCN